MCPFRSSFIYRIEFALQAKLSKIKGKIITISVFCVISFTSITISLHELNVGHRWIRLFSGNEGIFIENCKNIHRWNKKPQMKPDIKLDNKSEKFSHQNRNYLSNLSCFLVTGNRCPMLHHHRDEQHRQRIKYEKWFAAKLIDKKKRKRISIDSIALVISSNAKFNHR